MSGVVIVCLVIACGLFVARNIRVETAARNGGEYVSIDTPAGQLSIHAHEKAWIGGDGRAALPRCPERKSIRAVTRSSSGTRTTAGSDRGFSVTASEMVTSDPLDKVVDYYRSQLPNWVIVNERDGAVRYGTPGRRLQTDHRESTSATTARTSELPPSVSLRQTRSTPEQTQSDQVTPEYCTCGAKLAEKARFCHLCGRPVFEPEMLEVAEARRASQGASADGPPQRGSGPLRATAGQLQQSDRPARGVSDVARDHADDDDSGGERPFSGMVAGGRLVRGAALPAPDRFVAERQSGRAARLHYRSAGVSEPRGHHRADVWRSPATSFSRK